MKLPFIVPKKLAFLTIILGCIFSFISTTVLYHRQKPFTSSGEPSTQQKTKPKPNQPVRLIIPKLKVNASIKPVGLTPEGDMQSPTTPQDTAWYKFGKRPGEIGNAVISGHYGRWANGEITVFNDLRTLTKGDMIHVKNDNGTTTTFVVREAKVYAPNDNAEAVFHISDQNAHLNLITCQGEWDKIKKTFSQRLVIFTDKQKPKV